MACLRFAGAAAPLLVLAACSIPVAEAPPEKPAPAAVVVRQHRPPRFSAAYLAAAKTDALLGLEPADLAALERRVAADPRDWTARLQILGYATRGDQLGRPESLARRKTHVFWLIEQEPASDILSAYFGRFQPEELTAEETARARALWQSAAEADPGNDRILANAANFFEPLDAELRRRYLELAAAAAPENANYGSDLGFVYAELIIGSMRETTPEKLRLATMAERILDATTNAAMVETAVHALTSAANQLDPVGRHHTLVAKASDRLFARAKLLNPDLDEDWVHPKPAVPEELFHNPPMEDELAEARARVVRLPPSAFPELPPGIAALLTARRCGVPQISQSTEKSNLIRGAFFQAGEPGWAVICSTGGQSQILVFRNDRDLDPLLLEEFPDPICLAEEWNCGSYMTALHTADRDFILYHDRGGPEPPPIDHDGIDIAVVEKASLVRYFYKGEWLTLTGAD
jgi:hypothetical protein